MVYGGWIGWSKLKRFIEGVGGRRQDAPKGQRVGRLVSGARNSKAREIS